MTLPALACLFSLLLWISASAAMAFLGGDGLCVFDCVPQPLSTRVCSFKAVVVRGEGEAGLGVEREGRERREAEGEGRGERSWEAALAGRASLSSYLTHVSYPF